ncbi:hypothetical protein [Acinetobacter sp. CS-2]|uniref:hypothetical protein n=1 Tax=Acinetobacter sp. CS-2 TaxID=2798861 RepID=UPI001904F952|nr:hypothetical protein [Acinetobacter sp. CS-2]QQN38429.1 hypothetical protein JFY49_10355 [Acinetobacter sp. CS-2]
MYKLLDISYSKMSDIEKQQFDQAVQNIALEKGLTNKKLARGVAGLIVLGEIGGFTTYMLMSIFLSKIGLGVFGFGVFTGASTLLGIVLGPVGWAAIATWVLWGFTSPNKTKISKIVATIALIRLRLHDEETERRAAKKAQAALAKIGTAKLWAALSNESKSSNLLASKLDIATAVPKRSSIMNKSALTFLRPQNPQQAYLDIHRKKKRIAIEIATSNS